MFSTEDFIITVFCCVDDLWNQVTQGRTVRQRGFSPSLSDSEVITMEIVGEFLRIDTDKGIWNYFRGHWQKLFPQIKSRSTFVRQAANLWCYKQELQKLLAQQLGGFDDSIHLIDGLPIPLCHYQRAKNCRLFLGEAGFGYCAAKDEKYYGFRGHLVISLEGVITGFSLTAASGSEREAVWEITTGISGLLIGDKGYRGEPEFVSTSNEFDPKEIADFKNRASARHETFNQRLKTFKCLTEKFRHGVSNHKVAFEAVCVITIYQLENGSISLLDAYP